MKTVCGSAILALITLLAVPIALADLQGSIAELGDRDWQVRRAAAESLGDASAADKQAIAALTSALGDPDSDAGTYEGMVRHNVDTIVDGLSR